MSRPGDGRTGRRCALALAIALATATACGGGAPRVGAPGPRLSFSYQSIDGTRISSRALRGRVVVLHLFTVGAVAAQVDLEQLRAIADQYPDQVTVVGINLDIDGAAFVGPWRRANDVRYEIVVGGTPTDVRRWLGELKQVPTTVVLDDQSRERARVERQLAPGELASLVRTALRPPVDD